MGRKKDTADLIAEAKARVAWLADEGYITALQRDVAERVILAEDPVLADTLAKERGISRHGAVRQIWRTKRFLTKDAGVKLPDSVEVLPLSRKTIAPKARERIHITIDAGLLALMTKVAKRKRSSLSLLVYELCERHEEELKSLLKGGAKRG